MNDLLADQDVSHTVNIGGKQIAKRTALSARRQVN